MVSVNTEVNHKSFGKGVICDVQGKYITVKFGVTQKIFVYPDAFENYLSLSDGTVSEEITADLNEMKRIKQDIINKKHEENVRAMTKGIVIPGKEAVSGEEDEESAFKHNDHDSEDM